MASYLRPRRGTASAASAIVLKKGEIFCEFKNNPATTSGGTSCGAIKMGNGTTSYQSLGYFLNPDTDVVTWAATTADGQPADWGTYGGNTASSGNQGADLYSDLNALVTGSQNKKVLPLIKNLLYKLATQVTKLNNDYIDHLKTPYKNSKRYANNLTISNNLFTMDYDGILYMDCRFSRNYNCAIKINNVEIYSASTIGFSQDTNDINSQGGFSQNFIVKKNDIVNIYKNWGSYNSYIFKLILYYS